MREEGADTKSGGTGLLAAGIVIAGVIGAGLYIGLGPRDAPSEEELAAIVPPDASVPSETAPDAAPAPAQADEEVTGAEAEVIPQEPPTVDEVRLESDGVTVIAGRAAPGAQVSVLIDGEEVATATADARGAFAAVGVVTPSDAARVLTLRSEGAGGPVSSAEDVILAPVPVHSAEAQEAPSAGATEETPDSEPAEREIAAAEGPVEEAPTAETAPPTPAGQATAEAASGGIGEPVVDSSPAADDLAARVPEVTQSVPGSAADAEDTAPAAPQAEAAEAGLDEAVTADTAPAETGLAEAETAPAEAPAQSVTVLKSTEEGVELLQPGPEVLSSVAIDTIGYSDDGDVQLSGRAVAGTSEVRVYLDNRFVAALPVDSDGGWRGSVPEVDAGIYRLRVDEVNAAGDVTSRLETPFKREAPAVLAEASEGQEGPVRAVTVQTGDTLWAIARDRYGEGLLYVRVFEANRGDIRDPDLIYPGQVFDLPVE
ncbi:MAG: LysM peptidoglycan-binding domain-containing protein [Pseudomonadota bacterium]